MYVHTNYHQTEQILRETITDNTTNDTIHFNKHTCDLQRSVNIPEAANLTVIAQLFLML